MNGVKIDTMDTTQDFQDWECSCGYVNEGIDEDCLRCGLDRATGVAQLNRRLEEELVAAQLAKLEEQKAAEDRAAALLASREQQEGRRLPLRFTGQPAEFLGPFLLISLLSTITLGIYSAWGMARILNWIADNSVLDGRRLAFTGRGLDIFLLYLMQGILVSITLGIYTPWAIANVVKWCNEHMEYAQ